MSDKPQSYHPPQPPDQEAVEERRGEGDGPFGSDMSHLRGGTRAPEEHPTPSASAYSTGTDAAHGGSLTPEDARSRYDHSSPQTGEPEQDE